VINFESGIVNLRDKLQEVEKKKSQPQQAEKTETSQSSSEPGNPVVADVIDIRNENRLAALSSVRSEEEAASIVDMLKEKFAGDTQESLNAHKKANADTVMSFYPFE
jgi:hypothetical protein